MKYELEVHHFFQASHQLTDSELLVTKDCRNLHGHSYYVIVKVGTDELNKAGMVTDFANIKNIINKFDHQHINDVLKTMYNIHIESTAENIAVAIDKLLNEEFYPKIKILEVQVCEGYKGPHSSWAIYKSYGSLNS